MINREMTLAYKGESIDVVMTMGLINKIESAGVNVLQLAIDIEEGGIPPMSLIATMYAVILRQHGKPVSPDDVWQELNGSGTAEIVANARVLLSSMFPVTEKVDEKKGNAPE